LFFVLRAALRLGRRSPAPLATGLCTIAAENARTAACLARAAADWPAARAFLHGALQRRQYALSQAPWSSGMSQITRNSG